MTFRFADFELDEDCREIRLRQREIPVQPRVFDLLAYLIRHRDRVVGKDELLEALWPGTVVVDGALQRVVSLARTVLQQGGARDLIRTYARRGYRFCGETTPVAVIAAVAEPVDATLAEARRAFQRMDWGAAAAAFQEADAAQALAGADLERWAQAAQWAGHPVAAIEPLERAVAAHLSQSDRRGAARAALLLAQTSLERMDMAVAVGWHRRATTFLHGVALSREQGLLHYLAARFALFEAHYQEAVRQAQLAHGIGVELEDPDLEGLGLLYSGHALMALGDVHVGIEQQNEAAAAVLGGQISPWAGALIYCGVLYACRNRADWSRAAQWTDQFTRWCDSQGVAAYPGTCGLHRAEVLSVRGDLRAEQEIAASTRQVSTWAPWAEGDAYRVLGELRLGRGELEEAEAAFQRARELGWDPQPGYALLLLTRDCCEDAVRSLDASLADRSWVNRERRGVLLAHLVLACARAGLLARARQALAELEAESDLWSTPALEATVLRGRAEIARGTGRLQDAITTMRGAVSLWQQLGSPLNEAHLRLRLAQWLVDAGDATGAAVERALAQTIFERQGAGPLVERCRRLAVADG